MKRTTWRYKLLFILPFFTLLTLVLAPSSLMARGGGEMREEHPQFEGNRSELNRNYNGRMVTSPEGRAFERGAEAGSAVNSGGGGTYVQPVYPDYPTQVPN